MPRTKEQNEEIRKNTKKLILDSALKLFAEQGFQATSMSDIAKTAGVSKGLAYNYFDSKQHIIEAIMKDVMDTVNRFYSPIFTESDPYVKLEKLLDVTFDWLKQSFDFWRMLFTFLLQPGIIEKSSEYIRIFYDEMFAIIENIFKEIGIPNYVVEARILGAIIDGVAIDYFIDMKNYPIDNTVKTVKNRYSRESIEILKNNSD